MEHRIDCYIPWQSDEQALPNVGQLKACACVNGIHYMKDNGPQCTHTLREIAESSESEYILLYTKYDKLVL